jgi:hypothetical protein
LSKSPEFAPVFVKLLTAIYLEKRSEQPQMNTEQGICLDLWFEMPLLINVQNETPLNLLSKLSEVSRGSITQRIQNWVAEKS